MVDIKLLKKAKKEYIKGGISYEKLAKKYGIPLSTVKRTAKREEWTSLKAQAEAKASLKIVDAVAENEALGMDKVFKAANVLLDKLIEAVTADGETDADGVKLTIDAKSLKQFTSALKDLKDIKSTGEETSSAVEVIFNAGPDEWND